MATLITKEQAIEHLKPAAPEEIETDLALKMDVAEAHIVAYMKRSVFTDAELPIVQGAVLEVLANIFYDRGDRDKPSDGPITPRVKNSLAMLRTPALA